MLYEDIVDGGLCVPRRAIFDEFLDADDDDSSLAILRDTAAHDYADMSLRTKVAAINWLSNEVMATKKIQKFVREQQEPLFQLGVDYNKQAKELRKFDLECARKMGEAIVEEAELRAARAELDLEEAKRTRGQSVGKSNAEGGKEGELAPPSESLLARRRSIEEWQQREVSRRARGVRAVHKRMANCPVRVKPLGYDRYFRRYTVLDVDDAYRLLVEDGACNTGALGWYDSAEQLDALVGWLDARGTRERDLARNLRCFYPKLIAGIDEQRRKKKRENRAAASPCGKDVVQQQQQQQQQQVYRPEASLAPSIIDWVRRVSGLPFSDTSTSLASVSSAVLRAEASFRESHPSGTGIGTPLARKWMRSRGALWAKEMRAQELTWAKFVRLFLELRSSVDASWFASFARPVEAESSLPPAALAAIPRAGDAVVLFADGYEEFLMGAWTSALGGVDRDMVGARIGECRAFAKAHAAEGCASGRTAIVRVKGRTIHDGNGYPFARVVLEAPSQGTPRRIAGGGANGAAAEVDGGSIAKTRRMLAILERVMALPNVAYFAEPVDRGEFPDYDDVILDPMDLGTIYRKAVMGMYATLGEFTADMKLIRDNCYRYCSKRFPSVSAAAMNFHRTFLKILSEVSSEVVAAQDAAIATAFDSIVVSAPRELVVVVPLPMPGRSLSAPNFIPRLADVSASLSEARRWSERGARLRVKRIAALPVVWRTQQESLASLDGTAIGCMRDGAAPAWRSLRVCMDAMDASDALDVGVRVPRVNLWDVE